MATIAIFGATGYAGGAIRDEALRRGHTVISVSRKEAELTARPGLIRATASGPRELILPETAARAEDVDVP
jgi:putative NADH-flavin reductase